MMLSYFLVLPVVGARVINTQQVPVLGAIGTDAAQSITPEHDAPPAIGVHFTTSYAIAAARYQDGTTRDLAKVAGDAEYVELMARWTDQERDIVVDRDVAVLANLIKKTRDVMQAELGAEIMRIAPTLPQLPAYSHQAIRRALSSAGLTSTRDHLASEELVYTEFTAADAALAHDLRSAEADRTSRRHSALYQKVLYLSFDNSSFSVGAMESQNANQERKMIRYNMSTELGWWNLPVYDIPRAKFWSRLHEMILDVLKSMPRPPNRIILMGDHGAEEEFKEIVSGAMWEQYEFDAELMMSAVRREDASRLVARGAAEIAWRDSIRQREDEARRQQEEAIEL